MKTQYVDRFKDLKKQGAAQILRDNYLDQVREIMRKLRENRNRKL